MTALMMDAMYNYDSSADYWKLVKQENGKYGLKYDGFHSLYDSEGNLLIKNEMDEFDENGNNLGPWDLKERDYSTFNSYAASLGMLLGTYTNYMYDKDAYETNYGLDGNKELRDTTVELLNDAGAKKLEDLSNSIVIDVNPYLMTNIGVVTQAGITSKYLVDGIIYQSVSIRDEYNNEVGKVSNIWNPKNEKTNITGIENMIPEGKRFKAGMIKFEDGKFDMYGLSSTMPDPNKMGESYPALADGKYAYSYSLHHPLGEDAYAAMRIYDTIPTSWDQVIGKAGPSPVEGFPYSTTDGWGTNQSSTPGYFYENGVRQEKNTNLINFHMANLFSFVPSPSGNYGGSDGCQTQHPYTFIDMTKNFTFKQNPIYGYYTVNRSFFGDGTNGNNNWKNW